MKELKKPGVIINVGSASGLYPMYADPIYSGSKGLLLLHLWCVYLDFCFYFPEVFDVLNLDISSVFMNYIISIVILSWIRKKLQGG